MTGLRSYRGSRWLTYAGAAAWCVVVTGGLYAFGVRPVLSARGQYQQHEQELAKKQQVIDERSGVVDLLRRRSLDAQAALASTSLNLQSVRGLNHRLDELAALATECGLAVHSAVPGEVTEALMCQRVAIRLTGHGAYPAAADLLHRIHDTYPDTSVNAFELNGRSENPDGSVRFEIDLTWHAAGEQDRDGPGGTLVQEIP